MVDEKDIYFVPEKPDFWSRHQKSGFNLTPRLPIRANVICDTGASISLAPLSITQKMKMKINKSHLMSVRGADGKRLSSMDTSFIYMKAPASPSWKWVKVVITRTGENFLLSHANLKTLDLLSADFPEYLGERRRAYIKLVQEENELTSRQCVP